MNMKGCKANKPKLKRLPVGYHSKLSKRPNIYTFYPDLSTANFMFVAIHIMENNHPLLSMS